uniref:Urotensin-2 receptor-like n=1 Tax=Saccoglossus kowalevskii TaxID=10224 RepID=A0ABM0GX27_SACKO|nr:PREDICTED: urotensin-2 receptor-like [Saccoglossus kowalevskii]
MELTQMQIFIIVLFIIIFVIGMSGNVYVIIINLKPKTEHKTIAIYIINLAMADIFYISGTPFLAISAYKRNWLFGDVGCRLIYCLDLLTMHSSIYTLVVMSIERYLAVAHPISAMQYSTSKYARLFCLFIWFFAACSALPMFVYTKQVYELYNNGSNTYYCYQEWPMETSYRTYITALFVLDYVLPSIIMFVLYTKLIKIYWSRVIPSESENQNLNMSKRKIAKTLFIIIVVFWLCYTPFWVFILWHLYSTSGNFTVAQSYVNVVVICMVYANGCANPFLYTLMTKQASQIQRNFMKCCTCNNTPSSNTLEDERDTYICNNDVHTLAANETNI